MPLTVSIHLPCALTSLVAAGPLAALGLSGDHQSIPAAGVGQRLSDGALKLSRLSAYFIELGEQFLESSSSQIRHARQIVGGSARVR